jgi:REP-associated tyrosine transposase
MPEHVHMVVWPTQTKYQISHFLASMKLPVSIRAVAFVRKTQPSFLAAILDRQPSGKQVYRFWQPGGGYDRNLWHTTEIWEKIDYCHHIPVRRGLCTNPEDWYWSSASFHLDQRTGPLEINIESIPERIEIVRRRGLLKFD